MKSLVKNSLHNVIYQAANVIFPLLSSMYVARVLHADGVGKVSYAQNIVSYFVVFAALGLPEAGIRSIARARNNQERLNKTFSELFLINACSTTIAVIAYCALLLGAPGLRENLALYASCGLLILFNYLSFDWFYQGIEEYAYIVYRSLALKALSLVALFIFVRSKEDFIVYALIHSLATGGNYIFNAICLRKHVKMCFSGLEFKKHAKPLLILAVSVFLGSVYNQIDITMLGTMSADVNVAYYSYGHKIVMIVIQLCNAIPTVLMPRLLYCYSYDKMQFTRLVDIGVRILLFLVIPLSTGLFILAPQVVQLLFGLQFLPAAITVRWLVPVIAVRSFGNYLCFQLILCTGNEKRRLPAYTIAALLNILLNALLIPIMAENGAAIASVASELLVNAYQLWFIARIITIPFSKRALAQAIASTSVMALAVMAVLRLSLGLFASVAVSAMAGAAVYVACNIALKNDIVCGIIGKWKARAPK